MDKQEEYQSKALKTIDNHIRQLDSQKYNLHCEIKVLNKLKQSTHIIGNKVIFEKKDILYFDYNLSGERSNLIVVETDFGCKYAYLGNRSFTKYDIKDMEKWISDLQQTLGFMNEAKAMLENGKEPKGII